MSSLLSEAIIDAKALRESALQNAEAAIIDKYSSEVKSALEQLLEQDDVTGLDLPDLGDMDEPALDMPPEVDQSLEQDGEQEEVTQDDVPLASADGLAGNNGINLSSMPEVGQDVEVTIDLGALQESIEALALSVDEDIDIELTEAKPDFLDLDNDGDKKEPMKDAAADKEETNEEMDVTVDDEAAEEEADSKAMAGLANLAEDDGPSLDALVDAVMEKLDVDTGFELSGWAGRPTSQLKLGQERELAHAASTESETVDEEAELDKELQESNVVLQGENNSLKAQLDKYKHAVEEIKENLYEVNLSNARLLYTNRVLRNTSLNERQKDKIVEAISTAGSVSEAKTIYETLQSTVESTPKRGPQSLGEVISRRSSVIRATRQESQPSDTFSDRMRRLAGIKS